VMTLLDDMEWSEWSDHKIAEVCRVSHVTVGRIRKSLQKPVPDEVKYINKHGQEATMKKKETPAPVATLKPAEQAVEEEEDDR